MQLFKDQVQQLRVGYGLDENINIGPLVSEASQTKAESHVRAMQDAGSDVLGGGDKGEGLFFEPTVVLS